jgi:hypothetical protein
MIEINYQAEPTAALFHQSLKVVRGFMGPVGNGKSVTCINEMIRLCVDQHANNNGIRKSRWAIIRNTTPELRTTTLNTFKQWIPEVVCPITMHPIIMGKIDQPLADGTRIEVEFLFLALDQPKDVRKLLSLELSGVFINETREISYSVVKAARERIGRYPSRIDGYQDVVEPCKRKALLMDTNPPSDDHWWYALAENGHLEGVEEEQKPFSIAETKRIFEFFRGPSPLIKQKDGTYTKNPRAENIQNLPGGYQYYLDMIAGNTPDHINVMVLGNYGTIIDGRPVYPEYNDQIHSGEIKPIPGLPISLGWDFGLTPTVVITQLTSTGQLRVLAELIGKSLGVRQFARDVVKPYLSANFKGYELAFSVGDPAGNARGEGSGRSAIAILNDDYSEVEEDESELIKPLEMGFYTVPAPTNDITQRLEAVKSFLIKMVDAGKPGYIVNKSCKYVRQGKQGKYQFKRLQISGADRYHDKPDKNDYSHPADAEQYVALGYLNGYQTIETHATNESDRILSGRSAAAGY